MSVSRESNIFTSTLYAYNLHDALFVFLPMTTWRLGPFLDYSIPLLE